MRRVLLLLFAFMAHGLFAWTVVSSGLGGWQSRNITVYVNPANCPISEDYLYDIVDRAIQSWNSVPTAHITIARDPSAVTATVSEFLNNVAPLVPVILCDTDFSLTNKTDADWVPAIARVTGSKGHVDYAGILLNAEADKASRIDQLSDSELLVTVAHELGHVLGLGHTSKAEALMYYSISQKTKAVLAEDDRNGITYLYPRNEFVANPFGCAAVHNAERSETWAQACGFLFSTIIILLVNIVIGRRLRISSFCRETRQNLS